MARRAGPVWLSLLVVLPGCFPLEFRRDPETSVIPTSPFGGGSTAVSAYTRNTAPPATKEAAVNVQRVGLKIVTANPSLGVRPQFVTIGGDAPLELFHTGDTAVCITESLARKCKTEGELAALLSMELGRMASEKAAIGLGDIPDRGPPPMVNVGNEYGGRFGAADGTRMMELAKFERQRALAREQAAPPAPDVLARVYLKAAGYNLADFDSVAPLFRSVENSGQLEKLMTATPAK
jgi:hypothetical protein